VYPRDYRLVLEEAARVKNQVGESSVKM